MNRLSRRRIALLVSLLVLVSIGMWWFGPFREARDARDRLSQVLGPSSQQLSDPSLRQQTPNLPPDSSDNGAFGNSGPGGMPDALFGNLPSSGIDVQESNSAYTIHVPLADPQDANNVSLNVTPNHIQVSGQTGTRHNDATITSSFMQAFTTSAPVDPDHISRSVERNSDGQAELVITIPKQETGASAQADTPTPGNAMDAPGPSNDATQPRGSQSGDGQGGYNQDAPFGPLDNAEPHRVF
jgi:hypothetical protein